MIFSCPFDVDGHVLALDVDNVRGLMTPFRSVLETNVIYWKVDMQRKIQFHSVWPIVLPLVQQSRVKLLEIRDNMLTLADVRKIAQEIPNHPTLLALTFHSHTVCFPSLLCEKFKS